VLPRLLSVEDLDQRRHERQQHGLLLFSPPTDAAPRKAAAASAGIAHMSRRDGVCGYRIRLP
jgi:hypothetical protein